MDTKKSGAFVLTLTALITAMTFVATMFLKIPVAMGYIHLGDVFVVLAALILPKKNACFTASVGAALADLAGGFAVWAPWTFVIKAAAVLILQAGLDNTSKNKAEGNEKAERTRFALSAVTAAIWTAGGYYLAEGVIYGNWAAPLVGIPFNLLQMTVGVLLGRVLSSVYKRLR